MTEIPTLPVYTDEALASESTPGLIRLLVRNEDRVPRSLIDACVQRGDEMADGLGELLHKDYYWGDDQTDGEWWVRFHAVLILGLMPTERAGTLLVDYMRRIDAAGDEALADVLGGAWPALFRNKPHSALQALRAVVHDREQDDYLRFEAACAAVAMSRPDTAWPIQRALDWAASIAFSRDEPRLMRCLLGDMLLDFARPGDRRRLESLADVQSDDERLFGRSDVTRAYATGAQATEWTHYEDPWRFYTPEAFEQRQHDIAEADLAAEDDEEVAPPEDTYVRPGPKVGRNDPCPCGSGRKYKKCCLPREA